MHAAEVPRDRRPAQLPLVGFSSRLKSPAPSHQPSGARRTVLVPRGFLMSSPGMPNRATDPALDPDVGSKVTMAQTVLIVGLAAIVLGFTAWMIDRGYAPHIGLLTASGGVAVAGGLTYLRGLKRLARVWGQS